MSSIKQIRVADRIRTILSELLLREVADPRLRNITITEVELDPELRFADIYVNALGDESRHDDVMAGLKRAKGFLRTELGKSVRLRVTPELRFHWDETLERGERMHQMISKLHIPPSDNTTEDEADDE
jgi:ribosome-binding factor A